MVEMLIFMPIFVVLALGALAIAVAAIIAALFVLYFVGLFIFLFLVKIYLLLLPLNHPHHLKWEAFWNIERDSSGNIIKSIPETSGSASHTA